jgi:hypothetical protein
VASINIINILYWLLDGIYNLFVNAYLLA